MEELGIARYSEWARLPKQERADWIAYVTLRGDLESYEIHREQYEEMGFSLLDFVRADDSLRKMKREMAEKIQRQKQT